MAKLNRDSEALREWIEEQPPVAPGNGRCSRCGAEEEQYILDQMDDGMCPTCKAQLE